MGAAVSGLNGEVARVAGEAAGDHHDSRVALADAQESYDKVIERFPL